MIQVCWTGITLIEAPVSTSMITGLSLISTVTVSASSFDFSDTVNNPRVCISQSPSSRNSETTNLVDLFLQTAAKWQPEKTLKRSRLLPREHTTEVVPAFVSFHLVSVSW